MKKTILIIYVLLVASLLIAIKSNGQTFKANHWTPNSKYVAACKVDTTKKYQCWGTTKKGERCKRKVNTEHSFCYQHATQK